MFYNGAAHRCPCRGKKRFKMSPAPPRLLLRAVGVTLYALCIKKTNKKKKTLAHTSAVKMKKEVIKKPALIYTSVCVKANQ